MVGDKKKIAQLTEELEASQKALADAKKLAEDPQGAIAELQKENDQLKSDFATHAQQMTALRQERDDLAAVNEKLQAKIVELSGPRDITEASKKVAEVKPSTVPTSSFRVGDDEFLFVSPVFMFRKQRIVAEEALLDQDLLNDLVKAGVGFIKKV